MTVLAQSLLALMSSHLVALFLLTVWHSCKIKCCDMKKYSCCLLAFHLVNEDLGRLESRNVVSRDGDCHVLANVAGCL